MISKNIIFDEIKFYNLNPILLTLNFESSLNNYSDYNKDNSNSNKFAHLDSKTRVHSNCNPIELFQSEAIYLDNKQQNINVSLSISLAIKTS